MGMLLRTIKDAVILDYKKVLFISMVLILFAAVERYVSGCRSSTWQCCKGGM